MSCDIKLLSKTSSGKKFKELGNLKELMRSRSKPKSELEIENLVIKDMKKRMLADEMNELEFYEIQPMESGKQKYRSMHLFSDMALIRGTKFFSRGKLSQLERQLRGKLAGEPGYLLLLKEMQFQYPIFASYERYEENHEETVDLKWKRKQGEMISNVNQFRQEKDHDTVTNLDQWHKQMKRREDEKRNQKLDEDELNFFSRRKTVEFNRKRQSLALEDFRQFQRTSKRISSFEMLPQVDQAKEEGKEKDKEEGKDKGKEKEKLVGAIKKITNAVSFKLTKDEKVNKSIEKYLAQGQNLTSYDFQKLEQVKASSDKQCGDRLLGAGPDPDSAHVDQDALHDVQQRAREVAVLRAAVEPDLPGGGAEGERAPARDGEAETDTGPAAAGEPRHLRAAAPDQAAAATAHGRVQGGARPPLLPEDVGREDQPDRHLHAGVQQAEGDRGRHPHAQGLQRGLPEEDELQPARNYRHREADPHPRQGPEGTQPQPRALPPRAPQDGPRQPQHRTHLDHPEALGHGRDHRPNPTPHLPRHQSQGLPHQENRNAHGARPTRQAIPPQLRRVQEKTPDQPREVIHQRRLQPTPHLLYHPSAIHNNSIMHVSGYQNSFAMIDSSQVKWQQAIEKKQRKEDELGQLMQGVTEQERHFIEFSIRVLNTSKETSNDIIYNEAQRKITSMVKKKQEKSEDTLKEGQSRDEEVQSLREKMIREYSELQKEIERKTRRLRRFEEEELSRVVKEIDFKNYLGRFSVEAIQLLSGLFGYAKAEREMIKNGIVKK